MINMNKEAWEKKLKESGWSAYSSRVFVCEECRVADEFDGCISSGSTDTAAAYDNKMKIRNRLAREMRKDGWEVKCSTVDVMSSTQFQLQATRAKQQPGLDAFNVKGD